MGCVSSKQLKEDIKREIINFSSTNADYTNHIVSLTSSTYGALKLDKDQPHSEEVMSIEQRKSVSRPDPEIINTWELMEDLEDGGLPISIGPKKSPKTRSFLRGLADLKDPKTPLKFLNQMGSPKKFKKSAGKENKGQVVNGGGVSRWDCSPKRVLKVSNFSPSLRTPLKCNVQELDLGVISSRRRSLGPLFDPELVASFEKELCEEKEEQIKKIVSSSVTPTKQNSRNSKNSELMLQVFDKNCPPNGENSVVIYTTTLRGIRKTFEDCNVVRSILQSHCVQMFERDVSMDSGFKEELRGLMGTKQVKVPVVFVKGRLIGGADEIVKLEEEGKLGILFDGIPRAAAGCRGCDGVRFMMCRVCNGSCKVLDEDGNKTVKCSECNENGLIQCPICCALV